MKKNRRRGKSRPRNAKGHFIKASAKRRRKSAKRSKRSHVKRVVTRRAKRKSAKRVAAGRKAARTRELHARMKSPEAQHPKMAAYDRKRRRRRAKRRARDGAADGEVRNKRGGLGGKTRRHRKQRRNRRGKFVTKLKKSQRRALRRAQRRASYRRHHPRRARRTTRRRARRAAPRRGRKRSRRVAKRGATMKKRFNKRPHYSRGVNMSRSYSPVHFRKAFGRTYAVRGAAENPITPGGYAAGIGLGVIGALVAEGVDRWLATSPLIAGNAYASTTMADPAFVIKPAKGMLENTVSPSTPMTVTRWAVGVALTLGPLALSAAPIPGWLKTGMRGASIGAGVRTGLKGSIDLATMAFGKTTLVERVFSPELFARRATKLGGADGSTTYAVPQWTGAGFLGLGGRKVTGAGGCCSNCNAGRPCVKNAPLPPIETAGAGALNAAPPSMHPAAQVATPPAVVRPTGTAGYARVISLHPDSDD